MIKMNVLHEPNVIMSTDLVSGQEFMMDVGVGIGILYEVLEYRNIAIDTIQTAIPAKDCAGNLLLNWKNNVDYEVLED